MLEVAAHTQREMVIEAMLDAELAEPVQGKVTALAADHALRIHQADAAADGAKQRPAFAGRPQFDGRSARDAEVAVFRAGFEPVRHEGEAIAHDEGGAVVKIVADDPRGTPGDHERHDAVAQWGVSADLPQHAGLEIHCMAIPRIDRGWDRRGGRCASEGRQRAEEGRGGGEQESFHESAE